MPKKVGRKTLAENRKARHEFFIEDTYECGLALVGTEVKSIRLGKVNIKDSYAKVKNGEMYIIGMHVSPYEQGNIFNRDPFRERKLLLHRREINKLHFLRRMDTALSLSAYTCVTGLLRWSLLLQRAKSCMIKGMI